MHIEEGIKGLLKEAIEKNLSFGAAVILDSPKLKKFGDFSSNIALELARRLNRPPLEVARQIEQALRKEVERSSFKDKIERIEVKGVGFINFFLSKGCLYDLLLEINKKKHNFGRGSLGRARKVHIEFVSANPTGPLNVAHGRQAAFGDTLANLLDFSGYKVSREYYLNDEGVQIDLLGESLRAKYLKLSGKASEFPASGYQGKYIDELAGVLKQKYKQKLIKNAQGNLAFFSRFACNEILSQIKEDLESFGVKFNSWFSQMSLSKSGKIKIALDSLKKKGFIYQKDGAWWLASTKFGDDKDRVVIKSDSGLTYIAPDIAYHQTKFKRGFSRMINVWGPDHHGYIARIKAALSALGYDADILSVLIVQLVSLAQVEKIIPMSTRQGQYISLREIIQAVGKDAARFFFLMRKRDSHLHFDLELAKKQSLENPIYYIQYAHARILNILKFAANNLKLARKGKVNLSLLDKAEELDLIHILRNFPAVVGSCVAALEPHRITVYLQDLAKGIHRYYEKQRVVTEDLELTRARMVLMNAARIVLNNGLRLLAVSAPEKM